VLEAEILAQRNVNGFEGHGHVRPTAPADASALAAESDVVVVGHIHIEDELALLGLEGLRVDVVVIFWRGAKHSSNIDFVWLPLLDRFSQFVAIPKRLVSNINVILNREGELSPGEIVSLAIRL
jgi:hypothetical protein